MARVNRKLVVTLLLGVVVMAAVSVDGMAASASSPDFNPAEYGRVLTDEELELVDGDAGVVGAAVSVTLYVITTHGQPWDAKRVGGAVVSAALGAINPASGSGMAAAHLAKNGATAAATAINAYSKVSSAVVGIAAGLGTNAMAKD